MMIKNHIKRRESILTDGAVSQNPKHTDMERSMWVIFPFAIVCLFYWSRQLQLGDNYPEDSSTLAAGFYDLFDVTCVLLLVISYDKNYCLYIHKRLYGFTAYTKDEQQTCSFCLFFVAALDLSLDWVQSCTKNMSLFFAQSRIS